MFQTWLSDLSIRNKLMLAFAMVLSAVVAVSAVDTWSLARRGSLL